MKDIDLPREDWLSDVELTETQALRAWCSTPEAPTLKQRFGVNSTRDPEAIFFSLVIMAALIFMAALRPL